MRNYIISSLVLGLCFRFDFLFPFIFISLVPLLYYHFLDSEKTNKFNIKKSFIFSLIFNLIALIWVFKGDLKFGISIIVFNTIITTFPLFFFQILSRKDDNYFLFSLKFIVSWLCYELLILNWDFNFPWLLLGNIFSSSYKIVQWYDLTGVLGGTLWVLIVNILIVRVILSKNNIRLPVLTIFIPITASLLTYYVNIFESTSHSNVLIVQPFISPNKNTIPISLQVNKIADLVSHGIDSTVNHVLIPETAFNNINLNDLIQNKKTDFFYPNSHYLDNLNLTFFVGANAHENDFKIQRKIFFNVVIQSKNNELQSIYSKQKFTPFSESFPYKKYFGENSRLVSQINQIAESGNYSTKTFNNYSTDEKGNRITSIICFELFCGEYCSKLVNNYKTNAIYFFANEGSWGNSSFNSKFLNLTRLRAIESRKWIAKSSNTGISAIINEKGDIIKSLEYGHAGTLKDEIKFNSIRTFYSNYGDWIGYFSILIYFFLLIISPITNLASTPS